MHKCPARWRRDGDTHTLLLPLVTIQSRVQAVNEVQNLGLRHANGIDTVTQLANLPHLRLR